MSSIADPRADDREHAPRPRRRGINAVATLADQAAYYLGVLLAQAERDAAIDPTVIYDETRVRDHLIADANGDQPRDDAREAEAFQLRLLAVTSRVADEWSLPFDHAATRARIAAAACTPTGMNTAVDHARDRARRASA